ncbi:MAG TPA: D-aminoacylase [Thermoanaerobaculia bacterium]|nr:D-aminoacylase [Thermoanaerobaculia bacterium]
MRVPVIIAALAIAMTFTNCATTPAPTPSTLDLKITNGRIVDGTGSPWYRGDVGIRGDRIVAIGDLSSTPAAATIDAQNRMVAPGFIDLLGWSQTTAIEYPQLEPKVRQGVTTEVAGEGTSPGPNRPERVRAGERWATLGDYLDELDRRGAALNFAMLVGASNPRTMVIGDVNRVPTATEMREMEAIVEQAMKDGAIGIGSSLIYVPAMYSSTEELINLSRVAARYGGVYFSHIRDEGAKIDEALDEAFRIGREANIPVNIWHLKIGGRALWGRMPQIVEKIQAERAKGLDVSANVYPYAASSTGLSTLAPDWAMEGGYDDFQQRLKNPDDRARIAEALRAQVERRGERGIYVTQIYGPRELDKYEKKFIEDIAREMNVSPQEALMTLFAASMPSPRVIYFSISEDDVRTALRQPWISIGSDGGSPTPQQRAENVAIHPRATGTFPRVLGHYARNEKLFSIEEAVRRMTSQAAARANLRDRGLLREGLIADVVVFDPDTVIDKSTFEDPHQDAAGVTDVIVNGVPVLRNGAMTGKLPGRAIRGAGYAGRQR